MDFLNSFTSEQKQRFLDGAARIELDRGDFVMRRGEPGGDVYLVHDGTLEVLDSRVQPEVIVSSMENGAILGEMAFIDDSPRSLDIRASRPSILLRWSQDDLRALLVRDTELAAVFYKAVCEVASGRIRRVTEGALRGGFQRPDTVSQEGLQRIKDEARSLTESTKSSFLQVETTLRQNPSNADAIERLRALLDRLETQIHELFTQHPEPEAGEIASEVLCRELHPYLVRSALAERCIRRPQGVTGTAEILAHVLVNTAGGDGQLGLILDRWLLDRASLAAIRGARQPTVDMVEKHLPTHRNRRALLINAGTGSLVAGLSERLSKPPTILTVVDQSRDALAFLGASGIVARGGGIEIKTVQANLAQFAFGRARHDIPPQDAIVIHGLLEYMPERIAVSLLTICAELLHSDGVLVTTALGPSTDREVLDRLLNWPTIRRPLESLRQVVRAAGLTELEVADIPAPGLLIAATPAAPAPN